MLPRPDLPEETTSAFEQTMRRLIQDLYCMHVRRQTKVMRESWSTAEIYMLCFCWCTVSAKAAEVWMISGIAKERMCYLIHAVSQKLPQDMKENLSFHALTGCDTSSSFSGHGRKKCWKIFQQSHCWSRELVMMEILHQLNNLCAICMALQVDWEHIDAPVPNDTAGWKMEPGGLQAAWTRLLTYPRRSSRACDLWMPSKVWGNPVHLFQKEPEVHFCLQL